MVVKIQKDRQNANGVLNYNFKKVFKGEASVIGIYNMPDVKTTDDIYDVFDKYENLNISTENFSFQMTVNPNPENSREALTPQEAISFSREMMNSLGYKNQPIVIFQHDDIERTHYHIVSCRTNENGKKIRDFKEKYNLQRTLNKLKEKYHYEIGNSNKHAKSEQIIKQLPRFDRNKGDIVTQIDALFDRACEYKFSTFKQMEAIMESMGVKMDSYEKDQWSVTFQGLDKKGRPNTGIISEEDLKRGYYKDYEETVLRNINHRASSKEEKRTASEDNYRVSKILEYCLKSAKTENHLRKMLAKKGIHISISRNINEEIFGTNIVDHVTKKVYKGSELKTDMSAAYLQQLDEQWKETDAELKKEWKDKQQEAKEARKRGEIGILATGKAVPKEYQEPSYFDEIIDTVLEVIDDVLHNNDNKHNKLKI